MSNIDTDELDSFPDVGVIVKIDQIMLVEELGPNVESWKDSVTKFPTNVKTRAEKEEYLKVRLGETVMRIFFKVGASTYHNFFTIPKTQGGYQQSNLRKVKLLNKLPRNTKDWIDKEVSVIKNDKGFPELAK